MHADGELADDIKALRHPRNLPGRNLRLPREQNIPVNTI